MSTARDAISEVFADTDVARATTRSSLEEIREHLDELLGDLQSTNADVDDEAELDL